MQDFFKQTFQNPVWLFSAVVMAVVVNIVSTYAHRWLEQWRAKASKSRQEKLDKEVELKNFVMHAMIEHPELLHSAYHRATSKKLSALVILGFGVFLSQAAFAVPFSHSVFLYGLTLSVSIVFVPFFAWLTYRDALKAEEQIRRAEVHRERGNGWLDRRCPPTPTGQETNSPDFVWMELQRNPRRGKLADDAHPCPVPAAMRGDRRHVLITGLIGQRCPVGSAFSCSGGLGRLRLAASTPHRPGHHRHRRPRRSVWIVAKRAEDTYLTDGRARSWLKSKNSEYSQITNRHRVVATSVRSSYRHLPHA